MNMHISSLKTQALAVAFALSVCVAHPQTPPAKTDAPAKKPEQTAPKPPAAKPSDLKKYEDVVTKEAKTQTGLFKVHKIDEKTLWEIPANKVGVELLWQTEVAQLPKALGYPGTAAGIRVIRFTRRGNKLFMRNVDPSLRAVGDEGTKLGVEANNIEPIIMSFDIQTEGEGKSVVIDVSQLFLSDPQDFSVKRAVRGVGVDPGRSYIERMTAFPHNIETRSQLTMIVPGGFEASAATIVVHYSLVELPSKPMMGRLKDSRIGYFTTGFEEYGRPENRSVVYEFINRFRLEKKDPSATLSEPVKPIVYYLSREVPVKWREWLKKGIEDWQPAFEQAGFKNAIIAKDAPTVAEDPTWDPEDARYSVIRWAPSTVGNAMGPSIQDPRSGETISAHIIVWNDIVKLVENWYFSQAAATDPKARQLPMSDAMVGRLLQYVICHEVGHTLGLEHNFKASTAYSIAQLRDPKFTDTHGVAGSIMSYSRYNYVAQPGDGVTSMIGIIGPYDKFAIEYGYKPIPNATKPDDEKSTLDTILARQVTDPTLRFGNYKYSGIDPTTQSENISNDPVEAGRLGLLNIDRIASKYLMSSTVRFGEDYSRLTEYASQLQNQRLTELIHMANLVGGVVETDYHAGRGGDVFKPVPAAQQRAAVRFLTTTGMKTPSEIFTPAVINKISPTGYVDRASGLNSLLITVLTSESRLKRLADAEAMYGANAYGISQLVDDLFAGIWSDVSGAKVNSDIHRRNLHNSFLTLIDGKVNGSGASKTDFKPLAKVALRKLAKTIDAAIPKSANKITALHLTEVRRDIGRILEGKFSVPSSGGGSILDFLMGIRGDSNKGCWSNNTLDTLIDELKAGK